MKHRVLVVEDHRTIRDSMVQVLDLEGFKGIPAANGQEALDYLNAGGAVSVIVLDLVMPVMDGWAFRRAQSRDPRISNIPTILLSALEGMALEDTTPAAAIFQKPVDIPMLIATLRTLCCRPSASLEPRIPEPLPGAGHA